MYETDVLVIGAGFAGLSAALTLKKAGIESKILEARDRTGGRVHTKYLSDGTQIELGGQWIGPKQDNMYRLINKYGLTVFQSYDEGNDRILFGKEILMEEPDSVARLQNKLDKLSETIELKKPWLTSDAEELDGETFRTWLYENTKSDDAAMYVDRSLAGGLLAVDAAEFSTLQMMFYIKSGYGLDNINSIEGGAQQDRVIGGLEAITIKMAEDYGLENILFEQPVISINYDDNQVKVTTTTGTFTAKKVILAIPSAIMQKIRFTPELPVMKRKVYEHLIPPVAFKAHFVYNTPFWRDDNLTGYSGTDEGYIFETYDNSAPGSKKGVLTLFSYGTLANKLRIMSKEDRVRVLNKELTVLFGKDAKDFIDYIEFDWTEETYTRGCFSSHFMTNGWYSLGKYLNRQANPIFWASTELAEEWNGYADGAVASGRKAANKVIRELNTQVEDSSEDIDFI